MALTNAGAAFISDAVMNNSPTFFNSANAYVGVGDSTTAFAAGQTDLQAATNKLRKGMEASYPLKSAGDTVDFRALYGTSEANWAWEEYGIFNAAASGTMLTRKVESLGTKTSAQSWQFTVSVQIVAA